MLRSQSRSLLRCLVTSFVLLALLGFGTENLIQAQSATATLSGVVVDHQESAVSGAKVTLTNPATGQRRETLTAHDGSFTISQLPPSSYQLSVERQGFATAQIKEVVLNVSEQSVLRIKLQVGQVNETIVVTSEGRLVNNSAEIATIVDRRFIENQPLNGRSFFPLVQLAPGVVLGNGEVGSPGDFSVNGQRAGANYFTIDGVSANFGVTSTGALYQSAGGGFPAYSAQGTTNTLASLDAVQEFSIQTSTYAAEFGRQPGAQVSIVTRTGTNELRGSVFNYFRNDIFDANDFFANANGLPKAALRQNNFGFAVGGPVYVPGVFDGRNRSFFFVSYEGLRLRLPQTTSPQVVPSVSARERATGASRDILNAFPRPTGPPLATDPDMATFTASHTTPTELDATSLRIDHKFNNRLNLFGRYNYAPSEEQSRGNFSSVNTITASPFETQTLTLGATMTLTPRMINDLRFNYSRAKAGSSFIVDNFGGAAPPPNSPYFPSSTSDESGGVFIGAAEPVLQGLNAGNRQRQLNIVDVLAWTVGSHGLKFGVDFRRLTPVNRQGSPLRVLFYDTVKEVLSGNVPFFFASGTSVVFEPIYYNFSAFAQDTWKASDRLTLTYGLRYEVNPAPSEKNDNLPLTVMGLDTADLRLAPRGTKFYETKYDNFAPRLGLAYHLWPKRGAVVRGGVGIFYDLGYTFTGTAFSADIYPYGNSVSYFGIPLNSPIISAPIPPVDPALPPPFGRLFAYQQDYELPYTVQYNLAVEQPLWANSALSVAYVGAVGRRLNRVESLNNLSDDFTRIDVVRNAATSDYNALQIQFRQRFSRGLQTVASYTWASSIDSVSNESSFNFQRPLKDVSADNDRGPSDFDVRHSFTMALSYDIPSPFNGGVGRTLFSNFAVDSIFRTRSATPINVLSNRDPFNVGYATVARPDLRPGQPLYLDDPAVAGGRKINRAAFDLATPLAEGRQGNLGRNALRGFAATQWDASLRRRINLTERFNLQLRWDVFNLLNQPNFANPPGILSNPNFGMATQMLNRGLRGVSSLYQIGGPRSMQLALKVQF